jgi:hypothetical protein
MPSGDGSQCRDVFLFGGKPALFNAGDSDDPLGRATREPADLFVLYNARRQVGTKCPDECHRTGESSHILA